MESDDQYIETLVYEAAQITDAALKKKPTAADLGNRLTKLARRTGHNLTVNDATAAEISDTVEGWAKGGKRAWRGEGLYSALSNELRERRSARPEGAATDDSDETWETDRPAQPFNNGTTGGVGSCKSEPYARMLIHPDQAPSGTSSERWFSSQRRESRNVVIPRAHDSS